MGHVYLIMLVMFCQAAVFKEISALFDVAAKPIHTHHHNHHGKNGDKAISPTRAARDARARAERERWSKVTSWYAAICVHCEGPTLTNTVRYFFAATNYFLHGETIIYYFKVGHSSSLNLRTILNAYVSAAHRFRRCVLYPLRPSSPLYLVHALRARLCRLRNEPKAQPAAKTVRSLLLDPHELVAHCCFESFHRQQYP